MAGAARLSPQRGVPGRRNPPPDSRGAVSDIVGTHLRRSADNARRLPAVAPFPPGVSDSPPLDLTQARGPAGR